MSKISNLNFYRKCRAIVRHLPHWRYDSFNQGDYRGHCEFIGPDKARLNLYLDTWDQRVKVYGEYLDKQSTDTITLSVTRHSKDLARDIKRRIIVDYLPIHIAKKIKLEQQAKETSDIDALFDLLLNIGFKRGNYSHSRDSFYSDISKASIRIKHRYNNDFDVKISDVSPDLAIKLFYFVKKELTNDDIQQ